MKKLSLDELNRLSVDEFKLAVKNSIVVVLDNVRSMNNIGSVFRTCDAFLAERVFLCGITATPPHKDIYKTALGATDSVDWQYFETTEQAIHKLKQENYFIVAVEQAEGSIPLNKFMPNRSTKYALVFGHEVNGVQQCIVDMADCCLEIPQEGTKHSINISVSAGIVLWDFFAKLKNS